MAEKKRKYILFTKADGRPDAQKPCAFFISDAGCRNGAKCQFSHGNDTPVPVGKPAKEEKVEVKVRKEKKIESVTVKEPIRSHIKEPTRESFSGSVREPVREPVKEMKSPKPAVKSVREMKSTAPSSR
jgi:hypothetical protein